MKKTLLLIFTALCFFSKAQEGRLPTKEELDVKYKLENAYTSGAKNTQPKHIMTTGPEQDCAGAIQVCTQSYNQTTTYTGIGTAQEVNGTCLTSGETNSVWYVFTVQNAGTFTFLLSTVNDYDFALYDITTIGCAGVPTATPVRCNYSATYGTIGLTLPTQAGSLSYGATQTPTMPGINVTTGQTFALIVDNYSANTNGYTLTFGGTAQIFSTPTITNAVHNGNSITLNFSKPVQCSSIINTLGNQFSLAVPSGTVAITSVAGTGCLIGTDTTRSATLTFNSTGLASDVYTLSTTGGILDKCGSSMGSQSLTVVNTQPFSRCLEIESILVDACSPSGEGYYEMLRLKNGVNPINTSSLVVTWPTTTFLGVVQNAKTANIVSIINASILSCGKLIEPPLGIIPAGADVVFFLSDSMPDINYTSFANLSDTMYAIFQLHQASGTTGVFSNYSTTPLLRSVIIGVGSFAACSDTVTYDKSKLIMQNGSLGAQDGATVYFDWNGTATYINNGCVAPFIPITVNAGRDTSICMNSTLNVNGLAGGNYNGIRWSGGAGHFADSTSLNTMYTPDTSELGNIKLILNVASACGTIFSDTVVVTIKPTPSVSYTLTQDATPHYWDLYISYSSNTKSISWNWDDASPIDTGFYPSHTYATAGKYNICVIVTDTAGCTATYCQNDSIYRLANNTYSNMVYINVLSNQHTTGINQIVNSKVVIYPNPSNGSFFIETNSTEKQTMKLFDVEGKLVLSQVINSKTSIDASNLAEGIYNLNIVRSNCVINKKLVIVR